MSATLSPEPAATPARKMVQSLEPAVWSATDLTSKTIHLTSFRIGGANYETISDWTVQLTGRRQAGVWLHGLRELLACFVPGAFFVKDDKTRREIALYFFGDVDAGARTGLRLTLSTWLGNLFADRPSHQQRRERIKEIIEAANDPRNWKPHPVSMLLNPASPAACPVPTDELFFDALTVRAAAALASRGVRFRQGIEKILIPGVSDSIYNGIELVAFPPDLGRDGGYWAYVINVSTATYPERPGAHVVAHYSIRNWAEARPRVGGGSRKLDVFLPPSQPAHESASKWHGYRFGSFQYRYFRAQPRSEIRPAMRFTYQRQDRGLLELLGNFCGTSALEPAELLDPHLSPGALSTMSRVWLGGGDTDLSGGIGVPYADRADMTRALDEALLPLGLRRARNLVRIRAGGRRTVRVNKAEAGGARLRFNVLSALRANEIRGALEFYVFHSRSDAFELTVKALEAFLGETSRRDTCPDGMRLTWDEPEEGKNQARKKDRLTVRVFSRTPGSLSEIMVLDSEAKGRPGFTRNQIESTELDKRKQAVKREIERMRHYVSSCRAQGQGPACAILEMPETLKGEIGDPYPASKRAIAQAGLLPQVVLNPRPAKKDDFPEKIVAAVADSLRMLGVSPIAPLDLTLAGIGRIRRTGKEVLGIRTNSQVIPVAVRLRGDLLEAKLLRARNWIPYAQAVLQVLSGEYDRLSWKREDRAATERFCAEVLQELNRASRTLVFIEHDRSDLQTLNNGKLTFDSLTLAGRRFSTQDLSNLTVIRIYTDPRKLPAYFHDEGASWTTGLWNWGQQRTFYGLKRKPPTALRGAWFATISRRTGSRSDAETRLTPPIDEICVVLKQEDTDPLAMARIAHKLQGCHIQYKYDTRIQFPLHEAILLERNVTFSPT